MGHVENNDNVTESLSFREWTNPKVISGDLIPKFIYNSSPVYYPKKKKRK